MLTIRRIMKQFFDFIFISGAGWIIDFSVFYILANILNLHVGISNIFSALPAVTFVFMVSTKKIFANNSSRLSVTKKYAIYFIYQLILVGCVSVIGQYLYMLFLNSPLVNNAVIVGNLKVIVKLCITPITMIVNFIVMKALIEKL